MTKFLKARPGDSIYIVSLALLAINLLMYLFTSWHLNADGGVAFVTFCLHFTSAALLYLFVINSKESPYKQSRKTVVLLILLISAFALNRCIPIFSESAPWLTGMLFITGLNMLLFHTWSAFPAWVKGMMSFVMGISMMLLLYFTIYLMPMYPFSLIALIALGVSIHTFAPAFLLVHGWFILRKTTFRMRSGFTCFVSGALSAIIVVIIYCTLFNGEVRRLNHIYNRTVAEGSGSLPTWMEASQRSSGGFMEEKALKTKLVYLGDGWGQNFTPNMRLFDFREENRMHDPLIAIAMFVSPTLQVPVEDRIKILEALHGKRHDAQERLWTGRDLRTDYVHTKVKIWPKLHLAYTEKMITVTNNARFGRAEGIYTFHLPEGGVVTSLSLWVNGKEEKGILTTKEKADTAYREIVGVQMRDPSLVRWQEGNTVSVRVFPVAAKDNRRFRIGFTAPLTAIEKGKDKQKQLQYDNITFEGPAANDAEEDATVQIEGQPEDVRNGRYKEDWSVFLADQPITPNNFSFNGYTYSMQPYQQEREAVQTNTVYLDVNESWSRNEFEEVLSLVSPRPVYVWLRDEMIKVDKDNKRACFSYLHSQHFSMFPVNWIKDPAHALLISKSTAVSPSLADLEDSEFKKNLSQYLATPDLPKLRLLNIGGDLSPYLRSLKEFRVFRYEQGGIFLLKLLLDNGTFAKDTETDKRIVIDQSNIVITRQAADSTKPVTNNAPDHLLRLFAYNHIMQQTGKGLITGSAGQDSLVATAQEAYVVSPLSSLIVLETQKDYDEFNIKDNGNSLKNASMKSTGAVPEPHEWALIILALLTLLYAKFRPVLWNKANV